MGEYLFRPLPLTHAAAVVGESYDSRGAGHLFTEADWGEFGPDESRVPYNRSKTLAERRAHEIAGAQERWTLVTILPGVVQGPPPGAPVRPTPACSQLRRGVI